MPPKPGAGRGYGRGANFERLRDTAEEVGLDTKAVGNALTQAPTIYPKHPICPLRNNGVLSENDKFLIHKLRTVNHLMSTHISQFEDFEEDESLHLKYFNSRKRRRAGTSSSNSTTMITTDNNMKKSNDDNNNVTSTTKIYTHSLHDSLPP